MSRGASGGTMAMDRDDVGGALRHLSAPERAAVRRSVTLLTERLGRNVVEVQLFGSAARGDMWSARMPMRSDIDLLVLTQEPVAPTVQSDLDNETYPLFLESGRQISLLFRTVAEFAAPVDDKARGFVARVQDEGRVLYHVSPT